MTLGDFESPGRSLFTREVLRGGNSDAVSALQFVNMGYRKSPFISGLIIIIINYTQLCYILGPTELVHWGLTHPGQYQRLNMFELFMNPSCQQGTVWRCSNLRKLRCQCEWEASKAGATPAVSGAVQPLGGTVHESDISDMQRLRSDSGKIRGEALVRPQNCDAGLGNILNLQTSCCTAIVTPVHAAENSCRVSIRWLACKCRAISPSFESAPIAYSVTNSHRNEFSKS